MSTRAKVSNIKKQQPQVIKATEKRYHPYQAPSSQVAHYTLAEYARYHAIAAQAYSQAMVTTFTGQAGYPPYYLPLPISMPRSAQPIPAEVPMAPRKFASLTPMATVAPPVVAPELPQMRRQSETSREEVLSAEERWAKLEADHRRVHHAVSLSDPYLNLSLTRTSFR